MRLAGKVAIITGGGSGIGRASAILFAREGARVIIGNRNVGAGEATVAHIRAEGGDCQFVPTDVTVAQDVARLVETAVTMHGRLDCLFNNAGINMVGSVVDVTEADWQRTIDTNLKSVFLGCKYAIPHLIRAGGGTIINNSSNAGLMGRPNDPVYCASKHGVIGLTKSLALRHGPENVRVNAICPGPIESQMMEEGRRAMGDAAAFDRVAASQTALKRIAPAEEVAELVVFLASDAARNITGAAIPTDGGKVAGILPGLVPAD
ncbi:MAG TPA: SDR family NAD(P)-dependent oxidoreductase [Chloroflexota bacterium]|nr:SDR family NAD(P)-dependent oxidoreductase [Chloroflexota bacterium]